MTLAQATTYTVEAYNLSHASENKIHDDAVAQKLGFSGGLVPGVEVYAYACHPAVRRWGRAWLERGLIECRFLKPVYDGRLATVTAVEADGALDLRVESEGALCATGRASLADAPTSPPSIDAYQTRTPPAGRPPADETSLAEGAWLGIRPFHATAEVAAQYLRDVREADPLYANEGVIHPGQLLRLANLVLRENVVLQPWIHTGSKVANFAAARIGDELSARARVAANYERKGHRLVDLDMILVANGSTVLAHVLHTAVFRLRQLAASAWGNSRRTSCGTAPRAHEKANAARMPPIVPSAPTRQTCRVYPALAAAEDRSQAMSRNKVQQRFGDLRPMKVALSENVRKDSVVDLNRALADTIVLRDLYKKHHWQVSGIHFRELHLLYDEHQAQLGELIDEIAERIMQLGGVSIAMGVDAGEESEIPRPPRDREAPSAQLERLQAAHEIVLSFARQAARRASERGDDGSNDLLVSGLIRLNEKQTWFVTEHLANIKAE